MNIILEVTLDVFRNVGYFIKNNLMNFANIIDVVLPYVTLFVGQSVALERGYIAVGSEILIPLIFMVVMFYLRKIANKIGKGITIPVPNERFTEVDDDGEVSIENKRIQELLLYMADLEDWMEKKGILK